MALLFKDVAIYLGRYAFADKSNKVEINYEVEEKEITNLASDFTLIMPGMMKVGAKIEGYMDMGDISSTTAANTYVEPVLWNWLDNASNFPITVCAPQNKASGAPCFFMQGHNYSATPLAGKTGDIHSFGANFGMTDGPLVKGLIGLPAGTVSGASGNGTAYQITGGVPTGYKLWAAVHMLAIGSGGSVVIKVQSDDAQAFSTPTDRITFSAITARNEAITSLAGPIATDTWFRVNYTRTGGTDFSAVVVFGVSPY